MTGVTLVAGWIAFAVATDPGLGWAITPALVGGGLIAAVLLATRSRQHATFSPDSFQRGRLDTFMDISRVRVAGFGGLGLMLMAGLVALQYQLVSVALTISAVGGVVGGVLMILHRRRHGMPSPSA
jgi:hypothetical protein